MILYGMEFCNGFIIAKHIYSNLLKWCGFLHFFPFSPSSLSIHSTISCLTFFFSSYDAHGKEQSIKASKDLRNAVYKFKC